MELDQLAAVALAALTAALVLITGYYAWQTRLMVKEMAATRAVQLLPRLALEFQSISPTKCLVRVVNVGPGPALDVALTVRFDAGEGRESIERSWSTSVMAPGEHRDFFPPDPAQSIPDLKELAARYGRIELRGGCRDALGAEHTIRDELEDLVAWQQALHEARLRWEHPDPEKRLVRAIDDKYGQKIRDGIGALKKIADAA
jgi:hypothetical protein